MAPAEGAEIPADFFYDDATEFKRPIPPEQQDTSLCPLHQSLGVVSAKKDNLFYLDDGIVCGTPEAVSRALETIS